MKRIFLTALIGVFLCSATWVRAQDYLSEMEKALKNFQQGANPANIENIFQGPANVGAQHPRLGFPQGNDAEENTGPSESNIIMDENNLADGSLSKQNGDRESIIIDVLELKNMDVQDFLKLISKKSGLNIVAGQNVKGRITIYLKNVDVRDALQIILESNDLAYVEEDNIIKVMSSQEYELKYGRKFGEKSKTRILKLLHANVLDMVTMLNQMKSPNGKVIFDNKSNTLVLVDSPKKIEEMESLIERVDVPIETEIFDLSYAAAKDVSEKLSEYLTLNVGRAKFDERSNRIVVTDTKSKISDIRKVIEAFDVKEQEVLIEAKIIQIVLNDQHKLGVDWGALVRDYHQLSLTGDFDVLTDTDKSGKVSIGTLETDDYTFLLEALETVGDTNILSNPSIMTLNNMEAKILVGSTQPYVTTTTTTPSSGPSTTAESVNFIDVGVKLFATPTIHHDDYITMKIKPEVSSVTSNLTTSNNNTIPIVETSEAETTVTIKDGVTIVIGGLIKEEKIDSIKKVPILGDIPFLGVGFRNEDKQLRKTELVIFLTPHIVTGDTDSTEQLEVLDRFSSR
jgi:type II secretory pathway component GspD/PulD (secretin)